MKSITPWTTNRRKNAEQKHTTEQTKQLYLRAISNGMRIKNTNGFLWPTQNAPHTSWCLCFSLFVRIMCFQWETKKNTLHLCATVLYSQLHHLAAVAPSNSCSVNVFVYWCVGVCAPIHCALFRAIFDIYRGDFPSQRDYRITAPLLCNFMHFFFAFGEKFSTFNMCSGSWHQRHINR